MEKPETGIVRCRKPQALTKATPGEALIAVTDNAIAVIIFKLFEPHMSSKIALGGEHRAKNLLFTLDWFGFPLVPFPSFHFSLLEWETLFFPFYVESV